jgi:hypothetical protein
MQREGNAGDHQVRVCWRLRFSRSAFYVHIQLIIWILNSNLRKFRLVWDLPEHNFCPVRECFCKSGPRKTTKNNTVSIKVALHSWIIHSFRFCASHLYKIRSNLFATFRVYWPVNLDIYWKFPSLHMNFCRPNNVFKKILLFTFNYFVLPLGLFLWTVGDIWKWGPPVRETGVLLLAEFLPELASHRLPGTVWRR